MKKILVMFLVAVAVASCDQEDTPVETTGRISFVVNGATIGAGKISGFTPERLVVSVEDANGKTILDNKIFTLTPSEEGYKTEDLPLERGLYKITRYLVISGETAAYATPKVGAKKADLIDKPLPLDFEIQGTVTGSVAPTLIGISSDDVAGNFGYSDFGFNVPEGPKSDEWMNVRVKLEMILGGIYYQNVDAPFVVKGFDENNVQVWDQEFTYIGPEPNDLKIKAGLKRYTIEANKWGATITQTFMGADLWDDRVREGAVPVTRVFQKAVEPRKVHSYVTSWSKILNGQTTMEPISKVSYEYSAGKLYQINNYTWNKTRFVEESQSELIYEGSNVKKIVTYLAGQDAPSSEINYTHDGQGHATHIQHKSTQTGITTEVDLTYEYSDRVIKASYRLSNGAGFEYEMISQHGRVKTDRTTRGSQVCSEGSFTHDKGVNPLRHLGYTDYLLRNFSISNRVTEDVNYIGCAFPSLIPVSYDYVYDGDGYPIIATTNFRGSSAKTQIEYTYVE